MLPLLQAKKDPQSHDEIQKTLSAKLKRVYVLLEASAMPDDVKVSWKSLLPEMTIAQVDRLIALIDQELTETLSAMKKDGKPEKEFLAELVKIKRNDVRKREILHKKTLEKLDTLGKELAELEKESS